MEETPVVETGDLVNENSLSRALLVSISRYALSSLRRWLISVDCCSIVVGTSLDSSPSAIPRLAVLVAPGLGPMAGRLRFERCRVRLTSPAIASPSDARP
jgi:hypothetical protein